MINITWVGVYFFLVQMKFRLFAESFAAFASEGFVIFGRGFVGIPPLRVALIIVF